MPLTSDIAATYRGPRRVFARLLAMGPREDRALIFLMGGCIVAFISQWPALARRAHLSEQPLETLMGGALMAWLFIAPLLFYGIAALSHIIARVLRGRGTWFGARLALFWALLAASPLMLLYGLVAGFIGPGVQLQIVGAFWVGCFLWFWLSGLYHSERTQG